MPKAPQRTVMLHFRVSKAEQRRLMKLAAHYERDTSDTLRRLIADEFARLEGVLSVVKPKES